MNDKEKLISLLILADPNPYTCESESGSCELTTCTECRARSTADLLIANGVTVQECKLGVKKTNADRIRSMNDEELAMLLYEIGYDGGWGSLEGTLDWLRKPEGEIE